MSEMSGRSLYCQRFVTVKYKALAFYFAYSVNNQFKKSQNTDFYFTYFLQCVKMQF